MNLQMNTGSGDCRAVLESGKSFDVAAFAKKYGGVAVSSLKSGSVVYGQGEPADAMYFLQSGQIQITVLSSQGKEGILGLVDAGSFCGEGCLLGNRIRAATATSTTLSVVARFERASIIRAVRENPAIAEFFVVLALSKAIQLRENLISQLFDSSEARLARALLLLANHSPDGGSKNIIKNVDQEGLAQMIGTTRSRVNHFMNKFRKLGFIDYQGGVILVRNSLAKVAQGEEMFGGSEDGIAAVC
jgi:CRP/FNR family transcriptional regulator, cyclic AMP receptor protein